MEEIWRDIEGFEGLYQVSNFGGVMRIGLPNGENKKRLLRKDKDGYLVVLLNKNGRRFMKKVHRLVAEAFIPNPYNKPCIDHINTIKDDNRVSNLRWCTIKENSENPLSRMHISKARTGTKASDETKRKLSSIRKGELNPMYGRRHTEGAKRKMSMPILQIDMDDNVVGEFYGAAHASQETGIHRQTIVGVLKGRGRTAGGYKWKYKN